MREISLRNSGLVALVDDEDYEALAQYSWSLIHNRRYAIRYGREGRVFMHRMLVSPPDDMTVDHRNGNGLDNRRENLRICTHKQNQQNQKRRSDNTSGYKGVCWRRCEWWACIWIDGRNKKIGAFTDKVAAAHAYDEAARERFGEFARLNFPRVGEQAA